jgi:hypothetical protein
MRVALATVVVMASALFVTSAGATSNNTSSKVPTLNVKPSCKAAATSGMTVGTGRTEKSCIDDENAARQDLVKSWSTFGSDDRSHCRALISTGGEPSYVELLSCLEMSRDAKRVARGESPAGVPPAKPGPRRAAQR